MLGGKPITLFHVRGIRIAVDWSWFFVLFLVIFWLSQFYGELLGESSSATTPFLLALASAVGFFGSIVLHELGHAFVALRNGIGISSIQLWIFGGMARMTRESESPRTEFQVAVAGPLVTLAIVAVLAAIGVGAAGWHDFSQAALVESSASTSGVLAMVAWLAMINFLVLDLQPAAGLPDGRRPDRPGGRLVAHRQPHLGHPLRRQPRPRLRLHLRRRRHPARLRRLRLRRRLARADRLRRQRLRQGGDRPDDDHQRDQQAAVVSDIMDREPVTIPDELTVEQALDEYFLRYRWPWFPVVDAAHRFLGLIVRDKADEVPETSRTTSLVSDLLERDDGTFQVRDDAPLDTLLANRSLRRFGAVFAVDADGRLSGVITAEQVGRALRDAAG